MKSTRQDVGKHPVRPNQYNLYRRSSWLNDFLPHPQLHFKSIYPQPAEPRSPLTCSTVAANAPQPPAFLINGRNEAPTGILHALGLLRHGRHTVHGLSEGVFFLFSGARARPDFSLNR